jgi:hypothetical protein
MACNAGPGRGFVSMSVKFLFDCTQLRQMTCVAMASLTLWYAIELCFFLSVKDGCVEFVTTEELSQNVLSGPSNGTLNMCNFVM